MRLRVLVATTVVAGMCAVAPAAASLVSTNAQGGVGESADTTNLAGFSIQIGGGSSRGAKW